MRETGNKNGYATTALLDEKPYKITPFIYRNFVSAGILASKFAYLKVNLYIPYYISWSRKMKEYYREFVQLKW